MNFGALTLPLGKAEAPFRATIAASVAEDAFEDLDEVMEQIADGRAVAWVASEGDAIRGAVVTEVMESRAGRQCYIRHCAGEAMREWQHFMPMIEAWGRFEGCSRVQWIGRAGWERRMADQGYRREGVVMGKAL